MKQNILIIELSQENRALIENCIGYDNNFFEVDTTIMAENILNNNKINIIIINKNSQPLDAIKFTQLLKNNDKFSNIPVICFSNQYTNTLNYLNYIENEIEDLVQIPDNLNLLKTRVINCTKKASRISLQQKKLDKLENSNISARYQEQILLTKKISLNISNELKDFFNSIINFNKLIIATSNIPKIREYTEHSLKCANLAYKTLCSMIDNSFFIKGELENHNINNIIDHAIQTVVTKYKHNRLCNINIIKNFTTENLFAKVDQNSIEKSIQNILENAFDAINERHDIHFKGIIKITSIKNNNTISINIEDNGIGMHENLIGKIIDPFFTTKKDAQGMGLTFANEIISKIHSGTMTFESKVNTGTIVKMTIPQNHQ